MLATPEISSSRICLGSISFLEVSHVLGIVPVLDFVVTNK